MYSLLVLNKLIVDEKQKHWSETDIEERGAQLTRLVVEAWPGPSAVPSEPASGDQAGDDIHD